MTRLRVICSWCHTENKVTADAANATTSCQFCGHRADVARLECDCQRCSFEVARARTEEVRV